MYSTVILINYHFVVLRENEDISISKITYQLELNSVSVYVDISTAEYWNYKKMNK